MRQSMARKQEGQVFIIVALSLVALIGSVGLAVDSGLGYMVKARLNAAVDSASIAAARAVTQGTTQAAQTANAQAAAQKFFAANYPATGYLGSTPTFPNPTITFDMGKVTIDAPATATLPVTFMRVLNFNLLNVGASAQTVRKDLDLAFVIDTTGSMNVGNIPTKVKDASISFLDKFSPTTDRVALIQFAYGTVVRDQIRPVLRGFDRTSMDNHITAFNFGGSTNSAEGVWNARDQLNNKIAPINRSSLRVIVFLSDGAPNSFSSFFDFKTAADCKLAGTISTSDSTTANWPTGLRDPYQISTQLGGKCWQNNGIANNTNASYITKFPDWYNAHNDPAKPNDPNVPGNKLEFPIVSSVSPKPAYAPRVVTNDTSSLDAAWRNENRASRNLLEAMAAKSREEGIYVFTLGLDGTGLSNQSGPDKETGDQVLKCMANTADALPRCVTAGAGQPVGVYCHAVTADDLKPCFSKLASAILRITK